MQCIYKYILYTLGPRLANITKFHCGEMLDVCSIPRYARHSSLSVPKHTASDLAELTIYGQQADSNKIF